jgi:predicted nucleic acid-binding protein
MVTKNKQTPVIADTSGLVSMTIESDANHALAVVGARYILKRASTVLIPAELLAETINLLGKKFGRTRAIATGRKLTQDEAFVVVDTTPQIRSRALDLMENAPGGTSFTDCLVVATAEYYNTHEIYGFDDYFRKQRYDFPGGKQGEAA